MPFLCPVVLLSNTNAADTNRHLSGSYTVRKVKSEMKRRQRSSHGGSCFSETAGDRWTYKKKKTKKNQASNQKAIKRRNHDWGTIQCEIGVCPARVEWGERLLFAEQSDCCWISPRYQTHHWRANISVQSFSSIYNGVITDSLGRT